MNTSPMFQISADARLLYQRIIKAEVGETVTYQTLTAEVGRTVSGAFSALRAAVKLAQRDNDMVFSPVRGLGIRRLSNVEIIAASAADTKALRRKARRSIGKLSKVDALETLPQNRQTEYIARMSIFAAVSEMSSERAVKKVEAAAGSRATELPIAETLKAFGA